jgi:CBS domain-containing protein
MIPVSDVMRSPVIVAEETDTAFSVACKMVQHKIGCLVVCRDKKPIGILTDTDLIKTVICEKTSSFSTEVKDFMSSPVISVHQLAPIDDVAELMDAKSIKRVAVVNVLGELVGIVSAKDLIGAETKMIRVLENYLASTRKERRE